MIESVSIQNEACYGGTPQVLSRLSRFNFIFGSNATGKTTISRIIANESAFPHCAVVWEGGTRLETLVYNRPFVEKNFDQPSELKGIFTLGERDKDVLGKIATAKSELDALVDDIEMLTKTLQGEDGLGGKKGELSAIEADFEITCWALKLKYDDRFQSAFTGFRNSKAAFKEKLLAEAQSNSALAKSLPELERKAATVFGEVPETVALISTPDYTELLSLEINPILKKKVIGKADVDIAAMIQKLGNSDWVRQGRIYFEANDNLCPFCQQPTADSLQASLNEYFDESFETDTKVIEQLYTDYKSNSTRLTLSLQGILDAPSRFLDVDRLKLERELLESSIRNNLQQIEKKRKESSQSVELESLSHVTTAIKELIAAANSATGDHNQMVSNLATEKRTLTAQVWRFLLDNDIKGELEAYQKKKMAISRAVDSLTEKIGAKNEEKRRKEAEIKDLEKVTTSIQPTIDEINTLLKSFGFKSFVLARSDKERFYKIVRPDGTDAKETLSEGEKNFITFLYFYHLLKGSESESGITTNRVVVFDDPVSSLDSDVLFIVSTLIKRLLEEVRAGVGHIKQVFILTHNVYFHKEISFNIKRPAGGIMNEETFWTIRRSDSTAILERHTMNPIKTSYELLWMEVRKADNSSLSLQNTLRRILESYFKILGNVDSDAICACFEGKEKLICKSLFSWVNAGSHSVYDDVYFSTEGTTNEIYLEVFRKIFEQTKHDAHYKMMMGEAF